MATATKTPAKRATSQTNAAAAAKSTRTSARADSGAVKKASSKAAGVAAKTGAGAVKKAAAKRVLNGASASAPAAKRAKAPRAKSNGALPAELAGDVQELARITHEGREGEVVRKTRASSSAGGEAGGGAELAVPVQIGGLTPEVTRPAYWDKACADLVKRDRILKKLIPNSTSSYRGGRRGILGNSVESIQLWR